MEDTSQSQQTETQQTETQAESQETQQADTQQAEQQTQGGQQTDQTEQTGQETKGGDGPPEWMQAFPEDLRENKWLATYPDAETMVKDLTELASARADVPQDPAGYKLAPPEGMEPNQEAIDAYGQMMHKAGVTRAQAKVLMEGHNNLVAQQVEAEKVAGQAALEKAYGDELKVTVDKANYALRKVLGDEGAEAALADMERTGLGNRPWMITAFANIYEAVKEDGWVPSQRGSAVPKRAEEIMYPKKTGN